MYELSDFFRDLKLTFTNLNTEMKVIGFITPFFIGVILCPMMLFGFLMSVTKAILYSFVLPSAVIWLLILYKNWSRGR